MTESVSWGAHVCSRECDTCVFRPGNLMRLAPGRLAGMVAECRRLGSHITCHEMMEYDDDDDAETATTRGPICRGFYDRHGQVSTLVQIAGRLGYPLVEVDPTPTD